MNNLLLLIHRLWTALKVVLESDLEVQQVVVNHMFSNVMGCMFEIDC